MAKNDRDLFDRLRSLGLRKPAAKTLSELGDGASKKVMRTARTAISELRSLADELERRLPGNSKSTRRAPAAKPRAARTRVASTRNASRGRSTGSRSTASTRRTRTTASAARKPAAASSGTRAPRGANKAKILGSLQGGPKTASEVAKETGIGTGTVGSTLSKLLVAGEVVKADRGYALPS